MELQFFLSLINSKKWLLLATVIGAAAATWVATRFLPQKYKSSALIATNIIDYNTIQISDNNPFIQEYEIESKFANMIEMMKSQTGLNPLTQALLQHDLTATGDIKPFRNTEDLLKKYTPEQINAVVEGLSRQSLRPDSLAPLTPTELENQALMHAIEKALGYDIETLRNKIMARRKDKSDYLLIEYEAERPDLAYFVVTNYANIFLQSVKNVKNTVGTNSVAFYDNLANQKKALLDSLRQAEFAYASSNGVVALAEQSQAIVNQIKDLEMARDEEEKKAAGYERSFSVYDKNKASIAEFIAGDYKDIVSDNKDLQKLEADIAQLTNDLVESDMKNEAIKRQLDDLKAKRAAITRRLALARRDATDPVLANQKEIALRYIEIESNLKAARQAVVALNQRIGSLRARKNDLVKDNAVLNKLSQEIELAQKEYENALEKQSQAATSRDAGYKEEPMRLVEPPIFPLKPEPQKRLLLSAFAGVGVGTMALVGLFLMAFFDKSLHSIFQYQRWVRLPLLAVVNRLNVGEHSNFDHFFRQDLDTPELLAFRESIRKIRHDIETSHAKIFLFASFKAQEGKSFLAAALAYAFTLKNKKILIIDTNFKNNTLSSLTVKPFLDNPVTAFDVQVSERTTRLGFTINMPTVDIIGNKGGFNSPSELLSNVDFKAKINELAAAYDYVFLESAATNAYSDTRELVDYVDKVIVVTDATTQMTAKDQDSMAYFQQLDGRLLGGILNKYTYRKKPI